MTGIYRGRSRMTPSTTPTTRRPGTSSRARRRSRMRWRSRPKTRSRPLRWRFGTIFLTIAG
eukprot:10972845-Ditylum_brightwellii.AAC.1